MRVTIIAKGRLKRVIAPEIIDTGGLKIQASASLLTVINALKLPEGEAYAVILNNHMIPDSQLETETVNDGDEISLIVPIRGG